MTRERVILYHILSWIAYLLIIALGADELDDDFILKTFSGTLPTIALFYINILLIFPRYLQYKKYVALVISTLLACIATTGIRAIFTNLFPGTLPRFDIIMFWVQFRINLLFACVSFAYWFALKNYRDEMRWQQLEKEMADAKLAYLKNQLNPHFLYNSLSLLYSKTLPLSDEVSGLVGKISDVLRYSLEEAGHGNFVPLEKEVTHIKNYIDIHQLRFSNKLNVSFDVKGDISGRRIAPMMLITFVENAFKHGQYNAAQFPLSIELQAEGHELNFTVKNYKSNNFKEPTGGIGLKNVKNRLHLLYPDNHLLDIKEDSTHYSIHLQIQDNT